MAGPDWISDAELGSVRDRHSAIAQDELPEPLFEGFDDPVEPGAGPTTGERRRKRQQAAIDRGWHPLSITLHGAAPGLMLLPDAPRDTPPGTRTAPMTCGTCAYRIFQGGTSGSYSKCALPGRSTRGEATDIRSWWPACTEYDQEDK